MASQITSIWRVCSAVWGSDAHQTKHQSSTLLAFVRRIHRWPMDSLHKGPVTRKMFPFDDVIMRSPVDSTTGSNMMKASFLPWATYWQTVARPVIWDPAVTNLLLFSDIQLRMFIYDYSAFRWKISPLDKSWSTKAIYDRGDILEAFNILNADGPYDNYGEHIFSRCAA